MNKKDRIKEIDKQMIMVNIIDAPGVIMVGLGLYAKFGAKGNFIITALDDSSIVNILIGVGVAIMGWGVYKTFSLGKERRRLSTEISASAASPFSEQ